MGKGGKEGAAETLCRRDLMGGRADVRVVSRKDGPEHIQGYAAVFYDGTEETEFRLWDDLVERVMPGAFDRALDENDDVRGLFNHNADNILARTSAGTMSLSVDDTGLLYDMQPADTAIADTVIKNIRAGNIKGSSFAFEITEEGWRKEAGQEVREIRGVRLFDVGPVTFPAYEGTKAFMRAEGEQINKARARGETERAEAERRKREAIKAEHAELRVAIAKIKESEPGIGQTGSKAP